MSLSRRNPRRDQNEREIVTALRKVGASVAYLSDAGLPDLLVWHRGRITLLEIKTRTGKATLAQARRSVEGWPVVTARTVDEALAALHKPEGA